MFGAAARTLLALPDKVAGATMLVPSHGYLVRLTFTASSLVVWTGSGKNELTVCVRDQRPVTQSKLKNRAIAPVASIGACSTKRPRTTTPSPTG